MTLKALRTFNESPPCAHRRLTLPAITLGFLLAAPAVALAQDLQSGDAPPAAAIEVARDAAPATLDIPPANFSFDASTPQSGRRRGDSATPPAETAAAPLHLDAVLRQIEENYPKLLGADAERRIAGAKLLEKQGAFDPVLSVSSDYLRYNSTSTRGRVGIARQNQVALEVPTRSGIKYIGGANLNTGNIKSPLSSTGDAGEYFGGIKIPFMRDRGINPKFALEQQAELGEPLAAAEFNRTRLDILTNASFTYYDWVAAKRRIDINNRLYDLARLRAEQIRDRVQAGDLPPIDETEANQEIQRRRASVIKSTLDFQKAALKLSNYLWDSSGTPAPLPAPYRVPDLFPAPAMLLDAEAEEARRLALERRPELQGLRVNRDINDIDLRLARNQRRPGVDVSFAPGVDNGDRSIGPTMKVGVALTLPFRRREADGLIAQAQLKRQKIDFDEQAERLRILNEVNDAVAQISAAYARHLAVTEELALARRVEEGERLRYDAGDSTLFLVNQRERATAEAEIKLVEAEIEYRQARTLLRTTSGQL